jgi:hypothetical protein
MTSDQPPAGVAESSKPDYSSGDIVARAGRYYRNTRYLMCALLIGMGAWFAYDGWIAWPEENRKVAQLKEQQADARRRGDGVEEGRINAELKDHKEHSQLDLNIQKLLAALLPPLGIALLFWTLRNSRGEIRLAGRELSAPGHPTIDLNDIKKVNNDLWDRKGIAWIKYETAQGQSGEIRLDDFVYDRPPTDAIYDRVAQHMGLTDEDEESESGDDRGEDETQRESPEKEQTSDA